MSGGESLDGQATQNGYRVPTVDEIYHQHEAEEGLAVVMSGEVRSWEEDCARAVRAAGRRAKLDGGRDNRGDRDYDEESTDHFGFRGRYAGPAKVTDEMLREDEDPRIDSLFARTA